MGLAKVTSKGQVTLPKDIRQALQIAPGDMLLFHLEEGRLAASVIRKRAISDLFGALAEQTESRPPLTKEDRQRAAEESAVERDQRVVREWQEKHKRQDT